MGKLLNSPKVVVPLALASLGFITYQMAPSVFQGWPMAIFQGDAQQKKVPPPRPSHQASENVEASYVALLLRERWMPERWRQFATIGTDPFLTSRNPIETVIETVIDTLSEEEEAVVVEREGLDDYLAEHLGLDQAGFFVRFGSAWKREGDMIYTTDGRELILGKFAIAEELRSETAHRARVLEVLEGMQLSGVVSDTVVLAESAQDHRDAGRLKMSAVIIGGIQEGGIYQLGDLLYRNPALGLASVGDDQAQIVDRYGNTHTLELK